MVNKIGLAIHWDTLMNFFDEQLKKKQDLVTSQMPAELLLHLVMDNINIYRGTKDIKDCPKNMVSTWNLKVRTHGATGTCHP